MSEPYLKIEYSKPTRLLHLSSINRLPSINIFSKDFYEISNPFVATATTDGIEMIRLQMSAGVLRSVKD